MTAVREDNRRLSSSVAEMRADRRAQDRKIRDLVHQLAQSKEKSLAPEPIPQLPVEVVAPPAYAEGQRFIGYADDGSEIIYEGDAASGKAAVIEIEPPRQVSARRRYDPPAASERLEVTRRTPSVSARVTRSAVRSDTTNDAVGVEYRAAVELVRSGKRDEAIAALRAFLNHFPRNDYADNAQYWMGEAYYAAQDYQHALVEFRATIETYPRGNKVPDALLKVGYCYHALGQTEKARAVLEQVVNLYPKSQPAALATKRLETP